MRTRLIQSLLALCLVFAACGCIDDRIKQQASLLDAKTKVAKKEYNAAGTPDAKCKVADEYFRNADQMTDVIAAYMYGRKPTEEPPPTSTDVTPVPGK